MDKRKHPNAQLPKEELEALEAQEVGSSVSNDSFKKASAETLRTRRIIKRSRKWKAAKADAAKADAFPALAAKSEFAGFTFGSAATTATPAAPTGKPLLAMPTHPVPTFPASSGSAASAAMVRRPRFSFKRPKKANRVAEIFREEICSEDLMVVENALLELAKLAEKESSTIARKGGLLAIVLIMKHHVDHPGIQVAACQALEKLALDHDNEVAISEVGGLEAVIDSMMANFEDEKVHEAGWSALWNMTCQCPDPSIDMSEALQALTSCMVQHAQQPSVQRNACGTLANLCQLPERFDALIKAGGFVAIATALKDHWDNEDVQQEASRALSILHHK